MRKRPAIWGSFDRAAAFLALVLLLPSTPLSNDQAIQSTNETQRLSYTITFLGFPVAMAMLDEVRTEGSGGQWVVRGSARATAIVEAFTHIHNSYITRVRVPDFMPVVYERDVDEKGLRFRRIVWYGDGDGQSPDAGRLPPLPERYQAWSDYGGEDVRNAPAGYGNFFSELWWVRYADWENISVAARRLWVEGVPWTLTVRREGIDTVSIPGGRVRAWKLICKFRKPETTPPEGGGERYGGRTDYVTRHLIRESVEITIWIATEPERRPVAIRAKAPGFTVSGKLRESSSDEILP